MSSDSTIHDWLVTYLKQRLSRDYDDISINLKGEKKAEVKGHFPDLILGNHGMELAIVKVETERNITPEKADEWEALSGLGVKLIIIAPGAMKSKIIDQLWKKGIVDKVSVGSYDINIKMP
jgi:hypothetical protein